MPSTNEILEISGQQTCTHKLKVVAPFDIGWIARCFQMSHGKRTSCRGKRLVICALL